MIVGIISDTHDCLHLVDKAVELLNDKKVDVVLHAEDYVAPFVLSHFRPLKTDLIARANIRFSIDIKVTNIF